MVKNNEFRMFKKKHTSYSYILEITVNGKGVFKCFITPFYSNSNLCRVKYFLYCKMSLVWGLVFYAVMFP